MHHSVNGLSTPFTLGKFKRIRPMPMRVHAELNFSVRHPDLILEYTEK